MPARSRLFEALANAADGQAKMIADDAEKAGLRPGPFRPSRRTRLVAAIAHRLGPGRARPLLAAHKVRGLSVYSHPLAAGHEQPTSTDQIGLRHHRAGAGGGMRAAVFGANDGLVSNTSLIMGVAGASPDPDVVLLAGVAGLLAGAFSMAAGEWISMQSQRELFESQIGEERDELERYPEEEAEELALIYETRGIPIEQAREMTLRLVKDSEQALDTLAREELGLNPDDLGSPWTAAAASFVAFSAGAAVPLLPFLVGARESGVPAAALLSAAALVAIGMSLSLFTGRNALLGGLRMLAIGTAAATVTWTIGSLLGITLT